MTEAEIGVRAAPDRAPEPPWLRRHGRALLTVGGIVVVLAALAGWVLFGGERAHESSESAARERLERGSGIPGAGPARGLYRYEGSGTERTSFPPLTEHQGRRMPATVTSGPPGCWVLRVDFNTHHYQQWTYCSADGGVIERGGETFSRRTIATRHLDNVTTMTCDPPAVLFDAARRPGSVHTRRCTGSGTLVKGRMTATGTERVIGEESVRVGGQRVQAVHVRYTGTFSGAQSGTERTDNWFSTADGLLLRNEHRIEVVTDSPVGDITYREDARFWLTTLRPVRTTP